jgi:hypothetical protein
LSFMILVCAHLCGLKSLGDWINREIRWVGLKRNAGQGVLPVKGKHISFLDFLPTFLSRKK